MIHNRKSAALIGNATRPAIELLENRQLLSASLTVSSGLLVFNAVKGTASQTESLTLTNTGDATLSLGAGAINLINDSSSATADASDFGEVNYSSIPASLAAGQSFALLLNYTAPAVANHKALLNVTTNDPVNPVQTISLHGIGTKGLGGSNQPSLATILRAYNIPTIVGEGPNDANAATDSTYPYPPDPSSQEVVLQRLVKAGAGPVTINVLASFTASGTKPYVLGTYTPGNPSAADLNELFFTPTSESQSTYVQPEGATSFDPGTSQFGFYDVSNVQVKGRLEYTEDPLNTFDTTTGRHFRFFPMENPNGSTVPNTYIMTSTEYNAPIGYDFTNIVAIVSNVKAATGAPDGPVLGLQNLNALPGNNTIVFSRIQSPNTSVGDTVHDTGVLQVNNTGDQPLIISSYTLSSAWTLVSPPTFPATVAAGASLNLTIKFVAQSQPSVPYNETNSNLNGGGGGVYNGTITLNDNDPNTPTASVPLRGWWQLHSENDNEPGFITQVNLLYNWGSYIDSQPLTTLTENSNTTNSVPTYYGEEVVSAYWQQADPSTSVNVEQIGAWHTQGNNSTTYYFPKGGSSTKLFATGTDVGQTLFPTSAGSSNVASGSFNSTGTFGFRVDSEYSDDSLNSYKSGGGHHFRFYPVRDAADNLVPNTYIMTMDYSTNPQNFDFQDNVWIVSNIHPATVTTGIASPQTTGAPAAPTDFHVTSSGGVNSLQWAPIFDSTLTGYNIYRATSATGTYTLLNKSLITATAYTDTAANNTGTSYYKVQSVDSNATQSLGDRASVVDTGTATTTGSPVAAAEAASTPFQTAVTVNVFADATDSESATLLASTVTISSPSGHGRTTVNTSTGSITYTPTTGFSGTDTFQYTVGDNTGATSTPATVTITVGSQTLGHPVAANLSVNAAKGVPLVIDDVSSATDSNATIDPTTVTITKNPTHGTAMVNASTGAITYNASAGYTGTDTIQYTIGDSLGTVSAAATITIKVLPAGPTASSASGTTVTNTGTTVSVISAATDPDGTISPLGVTISAQPSHGTATVDTAGNIVYTPSAGYFGPDSLQYTLTDSNILTSPAATVSLSTGVAINNTTARSLTFVDNLGDKVALALTGGGTGDVFFNGSGSVQMVSGPHGTGSVVLMGSGLSISNITIAGTSNASALTISRKGTASVGLGGITISNPIGRIIATTTNLTGSLIGFGNISQLQLGSATGATISVGSASATPAGFTFVSGHVVNTTIDSDIPIKLLKVIDWTAQGATDAISAPSFNSIIATGNLQASLTAEGGSKFSVNVLRVGGQVDAEGWNINGAVNSVNVGSIAPNWTGTITGLFNSFVIKSGGFAGTLTAGSINSLTISGDDTGIITAGSIKSTKVVGQLDGATITLTNAVAPRTYSLGRLTVTRATLKSTITANGSIGAITTAGISASSIEAGTSPGTRLPTTAGDFTASATIGSFSIVGPGSEFVNTNIGAELIGSLSLGQITTDNGGTVFGVGATTVNSLTAHLDNGGVLRLNKTTLTSSSLIASYLSAHSLTLGDFRVTPGL